MPAKPSSPTIPLPRAWPSRVKSAILHVISLTQYTIVYTRGWAADSPNARMASIPPHRRPFYPPIERMAILELKAARGWSLEQTAKAFLVTSATIASWMKRLDEDGLDALVQTRQPVNRFPEFVRYVVQRLKTLRPTMGKAKIAETLARTGLHLGATTVGRMLKERPRHTAPAADPAPAGEGRVVTAKYSNHVWHVDLTVAPTGGFWTSWLPFALPQCWPSCYWVAIVIDHFSRRVMGVTAFKNQPTCEAVCGFLDRTIARAKKVPRYIVCDRGKQFDCEAFRKWCRRKGIKPPRYGAIGKHGSIAVVERVIVTIQCLLSCLPLVPYRREAFLRELTKATEWYNEFVAWRQDAQ